MGAKKVIVVTAGRKSGGAVTISCAPQSCGQIDGSMLHQSRVFSPSLPFVATTRTTAATARTPATLR